MKMSSDPEKEKKEDVIFDDEEEVSKVDIKETVKKVSLDFGKILENKLFRLMIILIIVLIILVVVLQTISSISSKNYKKEDVQSIMITAARGYFTDHPEYLPSESGSTVEVDSSNLIVEGRMKNFYEYFGDNTTCTGSVKVEKYNSSYLYLPIIKCGENYSSVELYKKVLGQGTVTSGYGLYSVNNSYVYRGENVNNYVKLDNSLWRIVKITANNHVVLVHSVGMHWTNLWDNRYNSSKQEETGINDYAASRMKELLENVYIRPDAEQQQNILSVDDMARISFYNVCTGKRNENGDKKNNTEECSRVTKSQKLGLLTLSDYLYASIDTNCNSVSSMACKNYNYLVIAADWWLVTADSTDSSKVFYVSSNGQVQTKNANEQAVVRPVIYLNSDVLYKTGSGTKENPYEVM